MRKERGLTLIELAIVLIVLGILLGIGAGIIGILIKRVKYNESKEIVNAAVEGIIGYVISTGKLPTDTELSSTVRTTFDSYNKPLAYVYDESLTTSNICSMNSTNITVKVCPDATCSSPTQTLSNIAFVVISGDGNYNNQTAGTQGVSSSTEIRVYEFGVVVDNYSGDMNRPEPYDDIVKWVSLNELKPKAGCVGTGGGGGGGGGSCSSYTLRISNQGNRKSFRIDSGSCNNLDNGDSFYQTGLNSGSTLTIREQDWCWDDVILQGQLQNLDSNSDCIVDVSCIGNSCTPQ